MSRTIRVRVDVVWDVKRPEGDPVCARRFLAEKIRVVGLRI